VYEAASDIVGAYGCNGQLASMRQLRRQRIGLLLAIAHPDRVRRALAARGVVPVRVEFFPDHGAPDRRGGQVSGAPADSGSRVDAWLTTSKCAQKLGYSYRGAPVWVLAHRLALPAPLVEHVCDALSLRAEPW
jgi:tetraacyldisaccharide-1-P 4'-kinase